MYKKIKTDELKGFAHIHIYYENQVDYFVKILSILSDFNCKIFITYINLEAENIYKLKNSNKNTELIKVDNIGFDVYPFLQILYNLTLDDYDYVLKLHTKNFRKELLSLNHFKYYGYGWRDMLIQPLIKNKKTFEKNLKILMSNDNIGAICTKKLIMDLGFELEKIKKDEYEFLQKYNYKMLEKWHYCSGTMFLAKPFYFNKIKELNLNENFFKDEKKETGLCNNPAATIERIFGYFIETQGGKIYGINDFILYLKTYIIARYYKYKFKISKLINKE